MSINSYYPKKSKWIFLSLLLVLSLIYNYHSILFKPPGVIHQWRQCDCLSLASNYYNNGMDFLSPAVYFAGNDGTGKTASEFPIIYYIVAFFWKIFGKHEIIFRLLNLSIVYTGLFFLFRFIEEKLKDSFWAIVLALFVFTSPILVYYSNGFIMDPLGLSFEFIAWYFFGKFYESGENKQLYVSMLFFLIGGLLKVSSTISYFALLGVFIIEMFGVRFKNGTTIFQNKKLQIIPFIVVAIGLYFWYSFAARYNEEHASGVFLVGILPIWDYTATDIEHRITVFKGAMTLHQFYNIETLYLLLALFVLQLVFFKKADSFLLFITLQLFFAVIAFLLLWFGAVTEGHDYYLTNLLVFIAFAFISLFVLIKKSFPLVFVSERLKTYVLLLLAYNIYLTGSKTSIRYFNTPKRNYPACYSDNDVERLHWTKNYYNKHHKSLREVEPYLRSLGIQPNDKVISLPDLSFDITLYFMNQVGWTQISAPNPLSEDWFYQKIKDGAKYLIINDPIIYQEPALSNFTSLKIGSYKNIDVYDLSKSVAPQSFELFYDFENPQLFKKPYGISNSDAASGNNSCVITSKDEYGFIISINPSDSLYKNLKRVSVNALYKAPSNNYNGTIFSIQINNQKDSILLSKGVVINALKSNAWQNITSNVDLNNYPVKQGDILNFYVWNRERKNIFVDDLKITLYGYK